MNNIKEFFRESIKALFKGASLFHQKKGTTLASSSSFYALITVVPFALLMTRAVGYFLGNLERSQKYIFLLGAKFFPEIAPQLLMKLQLMIKGPLFAGTNFTILNFIVLLVSTITFLNSIWMGIYFITEDKEILSWVRILKGFVIIGLTLFMVSMVFILPPVIIYIIKFIQSNIFTQFIYETVDILRPTLNYFKQIDLRKSYWLKSDFLHLTLVVLYFTILYRWLFSWKITFKESFVAAFGFSLSVIIGKSLFWVYIYYVRNNLMRNYGDLYTSVAGVIWLFCLMCFFFYGACVCQVFKENSKGTLSK